MKNSENKKKGINDGQNIDLDAFEQAEKTKQLLEAIANAQSQFIIDADPRNLFDGLLENLLELTESEYGFIGEIHYQENSQPDLEIHMKVSGKPFLKTHAITNIAWNEETRIMYETYAPQGMEFYNMKTLFGVVITTGEPVIANNPATDPRRGGLPEGHPPLKAFLGLPFSSDRELLGIVGIANKPGGYNESIISYLKPFLTTCANVIVSHRSDRARKEAENALRDSQQMLRQANEELEQRVQQRTAELAEAKEKADAANQAKSKFIANMSHELRSPLNAILGFTQIMTRSQSLPLEHQESVSIINRSGEHLLTLINNVLDLSKIEAGRITLNEKNFDLHRLLDDIHDMFQLKVNDKGLQLLLESAENLPRYIRTDEVKLRQILINLINNALKFTEKGGIYIRVSQKTATNNQQLTTIYFEVEDTGSGIAPEELEKLFEAFTQTASGKQAQEGTGLGLSISRKFVELMGGEMRASSRVGERTIFSFEIQCQEVEAADVETSSAQRRIIALEPRQPRYRILIVDDKPVNRQLLIHLLNPLGFKLQEASNGQEAIEMWEQWQPHLIWMDMRMPVMDGFEATQKIKARTQGQATAIIALTASVLEEERAVVLSAGCDDFLRKPFRDEQIFKILEQHLGVRYIYEETAPPSEDKAQQQEVLTAENLQILSPEMQRQLRQAVISASKKEIAAVVAKIADENQALSEAIATCFNNFEYDKILHLIPKQEV